MGSARRFLLWWGRDRHQQLVVRLWLQLRLLRRRRPRRRQQQDGKEPQVQLARTAQRMMRSERRRHVQALRVSPLFLHHLLFFSYLQHLTMMWRWVGYDETDDEEEDKWKKMSCKMKRCEDVDEGESYWRREEHEEEEDVHSTR